MFSESPLEREALCETPGAAAAPPALPDFLPSAQRALFLRIQHKQHEDDERARRLDAKQDRDNEEGEWPQKYPFPTQKRNAGRFRPTRGYGC